MRVLILGAAGFIGTNLAIKLAADPSNTLTLFDRDEANFEHLLNRLEHDVKIGRGRFGVDSNFESLTKDQDVVYHLISTTVPTTSNQQIAVELTENVVATAKLLDACVKNNVKKVVFLSSGGTVYGIEHRVPLAEDTVTYPISSYGIQKITIEKLLYLYQYLHGLDYRVIRLANPYGPYQRPNGVQGAVTTFTYKALAHQTITVFGDGFVVRDYIYIDDAIRGICNIVDHECEHRTFNLGCGNGVSIRDVLETIEKVTGEKLIINWTQGRKVDVPTNVLNISRYETCYGKMEPISLASGIEKTVAFMRKFYNIDQEGIKA